MRILIFGKEFVDVDEEYVQDKIFNVRKIKILFGKIRYYERCWKAIKSFPPLSFLGIAYSHTIKKKKEEIENETVDWDEALMKTYLYEPILNT